MDSAGSFGSMTKDDPDLLKGLFSILGLIWLMWISSLILAQNPLKEQPDPYRTNLVMISGNTLLSNISSYYVRPIKYKTLIDCLEFYESSGNPNAVGQAGERGCLQYMPSTWEMYCKGDPWDCDDAKKCADRMIEDGLLHSWTTRHFCDTIK